MVPVQRTQKLSSGMPSGSGKSQQKSKSISGSTRANRTAEVPIAILVAKYCPTRPLWVSSSSSKPLLRSRLDWQRSTASISRPANQIGVVWDQVLIAVIEFTSVKNAVLVQIREGLKASLGMGTLSPLLGVSHRSRHLARNIARGTQELISLEFDRRSEPVALRSTTPFRISRTSSSCSRNKGEAIRRRYSQRILKLSVPEGEEGWINPLKINLGSIVTGGPAKSGVEVVAHDSGEGPKVFDAIVVAVEFRRLTVVVDAVPIAIFVAVVGKTIGIAVFAGAIEEFQSHILVTR